nr:MAG TPA: Protein of unknown function (DUF1617) [Caudoviricetes sp.]
MQDEKEKNVLNRDIITMYQGLSQLASNEGMRLPARVSFAVVRNLKMLIPIIEDIDMARQSIAETYGTLDIDNPTQYRIPENNRDTVNQELDAIMETEVDVPLVKIKMTEIEDLNISIAMAEALMFMVEEEM